MYINLRFQVPLKSEQVSAALVLDLYLGVFKGGLGFFTLGAFCGQEMGSYSPKLLWERIWWEKCLLIWLHSIHLYIDEPKKVYITYIATGGRLFQL